MDAEIYSALKLMAGGEVLLNWTDSDHVTTHYATNAGFRLSPKAEAKLIHRGLARLSRASGGTDVYEISDLGRRYVTEFRARTSSRRAKVEQIEMFPKPLD